MSDPRYAISDIGVSGLMCSGWVEASLLIQIGVYHGDDEQEIALWQAQRGTLSIEDTGLRNVPTASFSIAAAPDALPREGQPVIIAVGTLENRLFGGYLTTLSITRRSVQTVTVACTAEGFARGLRRRVISGAWQQCYAGDIVRVLLLTYAPEITRGANLDDGIWLDEYRAADQTVFDICADLAARCNYVFFLDAHREAYFQAQSIFEAAWHVTDSERFGGLKISEDSSQFANRVIVHYSKLATYTETFAGDGATEVFRLARVPDRVDAMSVDGAAVTFGARYAEDNAQHDFSIDFQSGDIYTVAHEILQAWQTLRVTYVSKLPARLERRDSASIADRQSREGGDGIYDRVLQGRDTIMSLADARAQADAILTEYARPLLSASYRREEYLYELFAYLLRVGMRQRVTRWGYDATLTIQRNTLTIAIPSNDATLKFTQAVELGYAPQGIETVIKDMAGATALPDGEVELLTIEERS